jgi:hypothetical protein
MFCLEFGVKTVEFQAECQAPPNDLPGVWGENSRIPGGMPGTAVGFAVRLGLKCLFERRNERHRRWFCRPFVLNMLIHQVEHVFQPFLM